MYDDVSNLGRIRVKFSTGDTGQQPIRVLIPI